MITGKQRIRVDYAPPTMTCSLTANSAYTQVFKALTGQFNPDYTVTPLVITPVVMAVAQDGTVGEVDSDGELTAVDVTAKLGEVKWLLNGVDIATLPEWNGKYEINRDAGAGTMYAIGISRNIPQGERVELRFEAMYNDVRTKRNVKVVSKPVVLTCVDSSEDEWSAAFGEGDSVQYDVLRDRLALYDHEVANGIRQEDAGVRAEFDDSSSYRRRVPVTVYCGSVKMSTGFTLSLEKGDGAGNFRGVTADDCEVLVVDNNGVTLDMRLIDRMEYRVVVNAGGVVKARSQFSVLRKYSASEVELMNTTCIDPNDTERRSVAVVRHRGEVVKYPDRLYFITWMSDTSPAGGTGIMHNMGEKGYIDLARARFFESTSEGWIDIYVDFEPKDSHGVATDTSGNRLTDADGNQYILTSKN